ncbi:MAG: response regulator, partial [Terriglobales bacterium]
LDLNTPRSDGFEVLGKLRQTPWLAEVPIAIITSSTLKKDRHRSRIAGANTYIEKPSGAEAFISEVGGALRQMLRTA